MDNFGQGTGMGSGVPGTGSTDLLLWALFAQTGNPGFYMMYSELGNDDKIQTPFD